MADMLQDILTGGATSFFSGGINTLGSMATTKYAFDLNRQGIREQQEYNSPAAQMSRLKAAGLNPALVYGHGAVATSPGTATAGGGSSPGVDVMSAVNRVAGTRVAEQEFVNSQIQANILAEQAVNAQKTGNQIDAQTAKIKADTHAVEQSTKVWDDLDKLGGKTGGKVAGGAVNFFRDVILPAIKIFAPNKQ